MRRMGVALVLFATFTAPASAQQTTWSREVGVGFSVRPEGPVLRVRLDLEVPGAYPFDVPPASALVPEGSRSSSLTTRRLDDGNVLIELVATFAEPTDLPGHLVRFRCLFDDPDAFDEPFVLRHFSVALANGAPSTTVEPEVLVQSHPSGIYSPLP